MSHLNPGFALAALAALGTWAVHTFVGERYVARPLVRSDLKPVPRYTAFYCWHLVTLTLLGLVAGFAYAALAPGGADVGLACTLLAASFGVWNVALILGAHRPPRQLPQWALFLAVTAPALWGVLT